MAKRKLRQKKKNPKRNKFIYWFPRILGIVYILFISIFALDVFSEFKGIELVIALIMHLIPSFILLLALIFAWRKPSFGGLIWVILTLVFTIFFNTYESLIAFSLISLPPLVIGILFIVQSKLKGGKS